MFHLRTLTLSLMLAALLAPLVATALPLANTFSVTPAAVAAPAPAASGNAMVLKLDELTGGEGPITLKTVRTERSFYFSRPKSWQITGGTVVNVKFQHGLSLLPERSSLNVKVNNRILQTIALTKANANGATVAVAIPPEVLKDRNTLSFQVDQHYTFDCEDPFSEELWTTILPETNLKLAYKPIPLKPDLARFPFPLFDELAYEPTNIAVVAPTGLSAESQTATATVAAVLGQAIDWRKTNVRFADAGSAASANSNVVLIGTPSENSAISQLGGSLPSGLGADDGVIKLVPHPRYPARGVLIVSGNTPEGVRKAARYLASNPARKLMAGGYAIVSQLDDPKVDTTRLWPGFVTEDNTLFAHLGLETQTTRGFAAPTLHYTVRRIPDLYFASNSKVKLVTRYSYASQLDVEQSSLEVRLNGKSLGSVPLSNPNGETDATYEIELPAEDFYSYNDLEYQFFLFPDKEGTCRFVTDAHIWGTVHSTSSIGLNAERQTALPDVGLLNDGAFPFALVSDMTQTTVIMPDAPTAEDQATLVALLTRLGQAAPDSGVQRPNVVTASQATSGNGLGNQHLIIIGDAAVKAFGDKLNDKYRLVINGDTANLSQNEQALASVRHSPNQGVVEAVLSPFNKERMALLAYGTSSAGQAEVTKLFSNTDAFNSIESGNLVVVNNGKPTSVTALKTGEAKLVSQTGAGGGASGGGASLFGWALPGWLSWVIAGLSVIGLFALLKGLLLGRR
jgi:hypothetical protein